MNIIGWIILLFVVIVLAAAVIQGMRRQNGQVSEEQKPEKAGKHRAG